MKKIRAFAYVRVSGQADDGKDGFPRQRKTIDAFTSKAGISIVGEYRDCVAGKKDESERPAFKQMVADMLRNSVRAVVVERLDRLAREYRIQEELCLYLASHKIDLYSADTAENITAAMMGDPMKKALVQMRGVFAELDKSLIVVKLRKARDAKSKRLGKRIEGQKRFGARPGEQETLKRIRELYRKPHKRDRMSLNKIAAILNAEGRPTRHGGKWYAQTVKNCLNLR